MIPMTNAYLLENLSMICLLSSKNIILRRFIFESSQRQPQEQSVNQHQCWRLRVAATSFSK